MSLLIREDGSATLDKARHAVCMHALCEIKWLAAELPILVPEDGGSGCKPDTVRSFSRRIMVLQKVLVDALDNPVVGTHEFKGLVTFARAQRSRK